MKKMMLTIMIFGIITLGITGCGANQTNIDKQNKEEKIVSDILIDEIEWQVGEGKIKEDSYVLLKLKNNTNYKIKSINFNFTEKEGIKEETKNDFYNDIKESQGFTDEWMAEYIDSRNKLSQPITMYAKYDKEINIGEKIDDIKCYYMGGWTSKNVIHYDILKPKEITINYEKDGMENSIIYNFLTQEYEINSEN